MIDMDKKEKCVFLLFNAFYSVVILFCIIVAVFLSLELRCLFKNL